MAKANADNSWPSGFGKTRLAQLYTQELYWLAHRIDERCVELFKRHPVAPSQYYLSADNSSLDIAFDALTDASRFRELLFPGRNRPLYEERAKYLCGLLDGVDYTALMDKQVRNTLEHFPEYLDEANYAHSTIPPQRLYGVAFNIVFSHLYKIEDGAHSFAAYLNPMDNTHIFPVRVYVASTQTVHNFSWTVNLGKLATHAKAVKLRVAELLGPAPHEHWMSRIIGIGPA